MKIGSKSALLAWALLLLAGVTPAAETIPVAATASAAVGAEPTGNPQRVVLERKLRLVKHLLTQSPAVQRISQSNNAPAKNKLAAVQALLAKAEGEASAGRENAAIELLDESLRQIGAASKLVPDAVQQAALERAQNAALRQAIRTFQTLQNGLAARLTPSKLQTAAVSSEVVQIDGLMDRADALMSTGNQHEANVVLNSAYKTVVAALSNMLAAETIVYDLKFDSPADEFRHELARNHSYEELVPLALVQLKTTPETATQAERYVQQSRDLRSVAQQQASGGDYRSAMKTIQDATSHLQRSLRTAGMVTPQSTEFTP